MIVSCPNFAQDTMSGCVIRITKDKEIKKWFARGDVKPNILLQTAQLSTMLSIISNQIAAGFMFRKLIEKNTPSYVEPDHRLTNSSPLFVMVDNLKLYSGPDESYPVINSIPGGTRIYEIGYQDNNDNWSFTEYDGQYGWIPIRPLPLNSTSTGVMLRMLTFSSVSVC